MAATNEKDLRWFALQWILIVLISGHDTYLALKTETVLPEYELNPIGKWLIALGDGDVSLFLSCKLVGTGLALGILALIYKHNKKLAHCIILPVTLLQILLLAFLYTAPWW